MLECRIVTILVRVSVRKLEWKDMPPIPNPGVRFTGFHGKWMIDTVLRQQD
jgi:hypothetical protein